MTTTVQRASTALVAALVLATVQAHAQVSPDDKCEAGKNKAAGKLVASRTKVAAKAILHGEEPAPADYERPDNRFGEAIADIEDKADGMCPTEGDAGPMLRQIRVITEMVRSSFRQIGGMPSALPRTGQTECDQGDATLGDCSTGSPTGQDGAVLAGAPRSFTDNGDGTITDDVTRLMWEKLSDDGSIHDWDDAYPWGDAFNTKIENLNDTAFAGHSDWRLPNRFELETLLDLGAANPATNAFFNANCSPSCTVTTCNCTQSGGYWSSTSRQQFPGSGWFVEFSEGFVDSDVKDNVYYVRAVRPGS